MDWLIVEGVKPWDGRYEFDLNSRPLIEREWGWIKRHANYLPLTIEEGWAGGDPELFSAFAVIALYRAGRIAPRDVPDVFERFADAPFGGTIRLETDSAVEDSEEDDAGPPVGNDNGSSSISGDGSPTSSGMWVPSSGTHASDTSESAPARSPT